MGWRFPPSPIWDPLPEAFDAGGSVNLSASSHPIFFADPPLQLLFLRLVCDIFYALHSPPSSLFRCTAVNVPTGCLKASSHVHSVSVVLAPASQPMVLSCLISSGLTFSLTGVFSSSSRFGCRRPFSFLPDPFSPWRRETFLLFQFSPGNSDFPSTL